MTKPSTIAKRQAARKSSVFAPPSRPKALAAAVSLAVVAPHAMAAWDNQVEAWVRPGTDRSYGGIEGVLPLSQTGTSLTFADLKFKLGQSGTYEGNLGAGHRFLTGGGDWALGFYGAWDHRRSKNGNSFNQITGGAEARSDKLDFRFNYYWPLTDREQIGLGDEYVFEDFSIYQSGMWEEAMKGFDIEAGVLLPLSSKWETRAYAAYYSFEGKDIAPQTDGWRVRVEVRPTHNFAIGLSHQQDDMFDNQTSLELRYIFGKDSKPGIRSLKERMTDPWTRDIDIVVSTPQEGNGSNFGVAVPGIDVVHIDSDRGSDVTGDGSFENPYASTDYCLTQKCVDGVSDPAVDVADYNVIRLWEGLSQSDGGYSPINLYNGQMLAGEPVSAAMIVGQFHPGRPGAIDVPWNLDLSNAPVINGAGGPAIALTSGDNRIMGVSTVNGGIHSGTFDYYSNFTSGYVSGFVDIRNNDINADTYYTGTGISLANYNDSLYVTIGYNQINAANTGIELYNVAGDGGSAYMSAFIYGNDINVDSSLYYTDATGVSLGNVAKYYGSADSATFLYGNNITVNAGSSNSATGLDGMNVAMYYSDASQIVSMKYNTVSATGEQATGLMFANVAAYYAEAGQGAYVKYNDITASGVTSADGVAAINMAMLYASANQTLRMEYNTVLASDTGGLDSSTGVVAYNVAKYAADASQYVGLYYNDITADSASGNATGVQLANIAVGGYNDKYYTVVGGSATALQDATILGGSIYANGGNEATGVAAYNRAEGGAGGTDGYYFGDAFATQYLTMDGVVVSADANGNAYGVLLENIAEAGFQSTADGAQYVSIYNSVAVGDGQAGIDVYSANDDAYGVKISNSALNQYYAGSTASEANATQEVRMGNNDISAYSADVPEAAAHGVYAVNFSMADTAGSSTFANQLVSLGSYNTVSAEGRYAYGVSAFNTATSSAGSYYTYAYAASTLSIGNNNSISATAKYDSAGVRGYNESNATDTGDESFAGQTISIGSNNTITAASDNSGFGYSSAVGVGAWNDLTASGFNSSAEGRQELAIGDNNSITATAVDSATGVYLRNDIEANDYYAMADGGQTVTIGGDWYDGGNTISATATGSDSYAYGIDANNHVNTYANDSAADGVQSITIGSYNTIMASATDDAGGIYMHNEVGTDGADTGAWGEQSLTMGYNNSVSATATGYNGSANGLEMYNEAYADGYSSFSWGTQSAMVGNSNSFTGTANGTYGHADAVDVENDAEGNENFAEAEAYQDITFGNSNTFTATANGTYGSTHGITVTNDIDTSYSYSSNAYGSQNFTLGSNTTITATSNGNGSYSNSAYAIGFSAESYVDADGNDSVATGDQTLSIGSNSSITATANGTYGEAAGIYATNEVSNDNGSNAAAYGYQTLTVGSGATIVASATGLNGQATGVYLNNYTYSDDFGNTFAIAEQSFNLGAGSSITATGNAGATGLYASNFAYADGGTAQSTQLVDINGSALSPVTITATSANGTGIGLALYNALESESYYDSSAATQVVTVDNTSITASGYGSSFAVFAENYNHAHDNDETATQTISIDDSVLTSNAGDAVYAHNITDVGNYDSGTARQNLVVGGSSVYGNGDDAFDMRNSGTYRSIQTGDISGNYISASDYGVAIYNYGGYMQLVTVTANSFNTGTADTYKDNGGSVQILTVSP